MFLPMPPSWPEAIYSFLNCTLVLNYSVSFKDECSVIPVLKEVLHCLVSKLIIESNVVWVTVNIVEFLVIMLPQLQLCPFSQL